MSSYSRINCSDLKLGMRFSAPVFFDDGENMFLAEDKPAKSYHLAALARWNIPYLLTYGHAIDESEVIDDFDDVCELEEIEELEPIGASL